MNKYISPLLIIWCTFGFIYSMFAHMSIYEVAYRAFVMTSVLYVISEYDKKQY